MAARSTVRHWPHALAILIGLLTFSALASTPAHAAGPTFTVNSPSDVVDANPGNGICDTGGGVCTLRAAVMEANHTAGGDVTIRFGLTGSVTYLLTIPPSGSDDETTGDLNIDVAMTIIGNGPSNTIIDGNGSVTNDRVIQTGSVTVSMTGLTIRNGNHMHTVLNANAFGGGILQNGPLTLTNVVVSGNSAVSSSGAAYGGGIYSGGTLRLINSSVLNNAATTDSTGFGTGGGIMGGGSLTLSNSTVSGNSAHDSGGGIAGSGTLINSTVSGNTAAHGGGIYGYALLLINTTISGNSARVDGGGIYHSSTPASLFNVTVAGNTANSDGSGSGVGAGIANASSTVNFQNTIIGNNTQVLVINGHPYAFAEDCSGTLTSNGYNIVSETADCTINGSYTVAQPNLGPLQNNGGATQTHALSSGSPAIDGGNPAGCTDNLGAPLATDQRDYRRAVDGDGNGSSVCDMGAFEYNSTLLNTIIEETNLHVQYNGWRGVSATGTYHVSNVQNDRAIFRFSGTSVKWVTRKGPDMGLALVTIDGVSKGTFDLYSATPQGFARTFGSLADAAHSISVIVLHQKNASASDYGVAVDAFVVGTTTSQDSSCAVKYDTWGCLATSNASGGSYRFSGAVGATVSLSFTGDRINWIGETGPSYGNARVLIDGVDQGTFDLYSSSASYRVVIHSFAPLAVGPHTIEIQPLHTKRAASTGYLVAVDALRGPLKVNAA
jgi:CSLREA domain-containing protein